MKAMLVAVAAVLAAGCSPPSVSVDGGGTRTQVTFAHTTDDAAGRLLADTVVHVDRAGGTTGATVAVAGRDVAYLDADGGRLQVRVRTARLAGLFGTDRAALAHALTVVGGPEQLGQDPAVVSGTPHAAGRLLHQLGWGAMACGLEAAGIVGVDQGRCFDHDGTEATATDGTIVNVVTVPAPDVPTPAAPADDPVTVDAVDQVLAAWRSGSYVELETTGGIAGPHPDPQRLVTDAAWQMVDDGTVPDVAGLVATTLPDGAVEVRFGPTVACFPFGADEPDIGPCDR